MTFWMPLLALAILLGLAIAVFIWLVLDNEDKDQLSEWRNEDDET